MYVKVKNRPHWRIKNAVCVKYRLKFNRIYLSNIKDRVNLMRKEMRFTVQGAVFNNLRLWLLGRWKAPIENSYVFPVKNKMFVALIILT